jgi:hypothetical protein
MAFYGSGIFYGSGSFYIGATTSAAQGIPVDLRFYRTSQDGIYVFWWGFDPAFINPALATAGFDLELDTVPTFNSPNLVEFTQVTAITFQNGNVRKGFAVPVAARINATVQTWYARVRTHTPSFISDWSATLTWTIPMSVQQSTAEALMESLPDYHVYGKGDLLKPVSQRNSNLWVVENMYGNQFDQVYYTNFLTQTDNYVDLCVDENLYENFGVQFNFPKPNSMQYVDYRWILMNLYLASLVGSTNEAIILTVQSFTGVPPAITNIRDINNFILTTTQDAPITQVLNTATIVSVIDGTHLLVNSTVGWVSGVASDTTASIPFTVVEVEDGVHLVVNSTAGMTAGDTIVESVFYTSSPFIDSTLVVQDVTPSSPVSPLLTASTYAVLGASTVTNTGNSVLTGNLGLYPGTSVTGFPPGTFTGTENINNAAAHTAQNDAIAAYTTFASMGGATVLTGDLGGKTLLPGLYKYSSSAGLTGTLTLDAAGNAGAKWIFQIGSTLTTASSSSIVVINGGSAGNVYWQVGSSATLGTTTAFKGTIIAQASITATTSAVINGGLIALTGAVTLDTNTVTVVPGTSSSGLIVPPSAYVTDGALGYWTMRVPTTDTLQATFDTGSPIKVFDALQGATVLSGLVTFTNGNSVISGSGTLFLSQLSIGQEVTDPNGIYLGTIAQITDNTHATLLEPWPGPTEVVTAYRLLYTDTQLPVPVLWDIHTLAFGVLITIFNPGNFPLF